MPFVIAGLVLIVVMLAKRSNDPNASAAQELGPNTNIPATGGVSAPSPAMTGNSPYNSRANQTAMGAIGGLPGTPGIRPRNFFSAAAKNALQTPTNVDELSKSLLTKGTTPVAPSINYNKLLITKL
jgi:hypothetical protein